MKLINYDGTVIAEITANKSLSLDEVIKFFGEIHPEATEENVEIDGKWYYYDDLDLVYD